MIWLFFIFLSNFKSLLVTSVISSYILQNWSHFYFRTQIFKLFWFLGTPSLFVLHRYIGQYHMEINREVINTYLTFNVTFNFMTPFLWMGFNCLKAKVTLRRQKFPEILGTHFIDLGRMKGWVKLGATQWFWTRGFWNENPARIISDNVTIPLELFWFWSNLITLYT